MIRIAFILLLSSCTVPRLNGPTADDLAGAPMVLNWDGPYIPSQDYFPEPAFLNEPIRGFSIDLADTTDWITVGDGIMIGFDTINFVTSEYWLIKPECNHFFIKEAYTINDIRTGADYHPCICLHCKIIEVCK